MSKREREQEKNDGGRFKYFKKSHEEEMLPDLFSVFKGEVAELKPYGAFIKIPGLSRKQVQGRGRGYRTRRPRGRGHAPRRRGVVRRSGSRGITRADVAIENTEQRHILLNKKIDELNEEEAKKLLKKTVEMCPGLIFNLIEERVSSGQGYHPPYDSQQPSWCVCTNCREMPTELERVCCNRHPDSCISRLPDFSVLILDEGVLALARLYRQEILVLPAENDLSKANRHSAYRQFVLWHHGRLGEGIRRVIPSCCVWRIRDRFPDSFGQYSGFIPSRFN